MSRPDVPPAGGPESPGRSVPIPSFQIIGPEEILTKRRGQVIGDVSGADLGPVCHAAKVVLAALHSASVLRDEISLHICYPQLHSLREKIDRLRPTLVEDLARAGPNPVQAVVEALVDGPKLWTGPRLRVQALGALDSLTRMLEQQFLSAESKSFSERDGLWLFIADSVLKLDKAIELLEADTAPEVKPVEPRDGRKSAHSPSAGQAYAGVRRKRGRPPSPSQDLEKDHRLFDDWKAAKASGTRTIEEFAEARGLDARDVRSALDRHLKRRPHARADTPRPHAALGPPRHR